MGFSGVLFRALFHPGFFTEKIAVQKNRQAYAYKKQDEAVVIRGVKQYRTEGHRELYSG
jgi:hypothetical protein